MLLRKLDLEYDATDRIGALRTMHEARTRGELVTGLLYVDTSARDLCARERLPSVPLAQLGEDRAAHFPCGLVEPYAITDAVGPAPAASLPC